MTNADMLAAVVGTLVPALIALINRPNWSPEAKGLVTIVVCALVAIATAYVTGQIDPTDVVRTILIVFLLAIGTYNTYWRPSGIAGRLEQAV